MAGEGAAGAELGLRPSGPDPRWRPHWDTGQSWVQRWPSSGSQSGSRGLGLGLVPLATELVPEPKEGPSLSEGRGAGSGPLVQLRWPLPSGIPSPRVFRALPL